MLKVLLVDDEIIICRGLQEIINWGYMDMEIVGNAGDGELGLELIHSKQPDIVITDIKMPFMDGLQMIESCCKEGIQTKFIVLSGYDEFDYAKKALRSGVKDYLLKPVEVGELEKVLERIKKEIEEEKNSKEYLNDLEKKFVESFDSLREKFIYNIVKGRIQLSASNFDFYKIKFENRYFQIILIEPDDLCEAPEYIENIEAERQKMKLAACETAKKTFDSYRLNYLFSGFGDTAFFIINREKEEELKLQQILEQVSSTIERFTKKTVSIGVSSAVAGVDKLPALYRQALMSLKYKLFEGRGSLLFYNDLESSYKVRYFFPYDKLKLLVLSIIDCDEQKVNIVTDAIFREIKKQSRLHPHHIYSMCAEILLSVRKALEEVGVDMEDVKNEDILSFHVISSKQTIDELNSWMIGIFEEVIRYLQNRHTNTSSESIDKIILFIKMNYSEDITLETISKRFFIEPTYFSKIFKKATGQTYLNFLTKTRIEKACELLKNPEIMVYEVAGKVGYDNQRYFSQIFRKHVSLSPSEYQDKYTK